MPKPKPSTCQGCPVYDPRRAGHTGFVPDWWPPDRGFPAPAVMLWCEAPGAHEVQDETGPGGYGRPLVGPTGWLLERLLPTGTKRRQYAIANTIRCKPPANKYPVGEIRTKAEVHCRQYERPFQPTVVGVTWHPAACFRTPHLEGFIRRHLKDTFDLAEGGERPLLCMGAKAVERHLPWLLRGEELKHWAGFFVRADAEEGTEPLPKKTVFAAV